MFAVSETDWNEAGNTSGSTAVVVAFRYIARELAGVFAVVFVLLLLVGLGGRFIGFLQDAAAGRFAAEVLGWLVLFRMPEFIQVTAPFAFVLALILTLGRLHAEQEFVVLTAGGARPQRLLRWVAVYVAPVALLVGWLSLEMTDAARRAYAELSLEQLEMSEFDAITPGVFHLFDHGQRVTYAAGVDRQTKELEGVFLNEHQDRVSVTHWAETGRILRSDDAKTRYLVLNNGTRYEGEIGSLDYREIVFEELGQRIDPPGIARLVDDVRAFETTDLSTTEPTQAAELHWRWALPALTIIGAFIAVGMARVKPRAGRFAKVLPGIGMFVAYYLLVVLTKNLIQDGGWPFAATFVPHIVMSVVAIALIRRSYSPA